MGTGGACVGPNGVIYCGFCLQDCSSGKGVVRAHAASDGKVLWTREFDQGINATPAVGTLGPSGRLAVIVPEGANPTIPDTLGAYFAGKLVVTSLAYICLNWCGMYSKRRP